jgi:lipopolysaccharide/colanic/teichoic acid biosynthesis glycosyltransferase
MPRWMDYVLAALGLIVLSPLLILLAATVRLSGVGPILFQQERIGLGGRPFQIFKFRTMRPDAERSGGKLTHGERDPRVTPLGALLRRFKLDELPQLINVLRGEMRLVGPRPEVPEYVRLYDEIQRAVLLVPPGMTDPASIAFRDEGRLLAAAPDPERVYVEEILPRKLAINASYLDHRTGWSDVGVIFETIQKAVLRR